jgi:hypothetical protein
MNFLKFDINSILPETQRRMKITLLVLFVNVIVFNIGMLLKTNLLELGGGLAAIEIPFLTWVIGESIRPTGEYKMVKTTTTSTDPSTGTVKEIIKNE